MLFNLLEDTTILHPVSCAVYKQPLENILFSSHFLRHKFVLAKALFKFHNITGGTKPKPINSFAGQITNCDYRYFIF